MPTVEYLQICASTSAKTRSTTTSTVSTPPSRRRFLITAAIWPTVAFVAVPITQAATIEALPTEDMGSATGMWGMILSLGGSIGMFVMSGVLSIASIDWVFYTSAVFTLGCTVLIVMMKGYFE